MKIDPILDVEGGKRHFGLERWSFAFRIMVVYALLAVPVWGAGLSIQTTFVPQSNTVVLTLQGGDSDWAYRIDASPAGAHPVFSPLIVGQPGQLVFTVPVTAQQVMFYRAYGTNRFGPSIPAGAMAGPARTPALGYNSWFDSSTDISESLTMAIADAMATNGMKAAGYKYLVLDQGWTGQARNPDGTPMISTNFPHGMAYLANYVHSKGLLLGLYTTSATNFHGFLGSGGYFAEDGRLFANWGVDYVKFDGDTRAGFELFANAFLASGRQLFFAPSYGHFESWIPAETSSWRGNGGVHGLTDLSPFGGLAPDGNVYSGWEILLEHIDYVAQYANTAGPGHWNDPDEADMNVFTAKYTKPEMAMFSVLACNLMWDGVPPIHGLHTDALYYMTNSEVLAVHQDAAGIPGTLVATNASGLGQVWCRPLGALTSNVKAVCLLNRSTDTVETITAPWSALGLTNSTASVRDLFAHANVGNFTSGYTITLQPKDCQLVLVKGGGAPILHPGTNFLSDQGYLTGFTNGSASLFQHPGTVWPAMDMSDPMTPMRINGKTYAKGIGTDANCWLQYALSGLATTFHAEIGIDDLFSTRAQAVFRVWLDGNLLYDSGIMIPGSTTQVLDLNVTGGQILTLQAVTAEPGGETANDACDWGNAFVYCQ